MVTATAPPQTRTSVRVHVQKFGTFLSNMIMPNIAAIIAWGLVTAFFIPVGWTPSAKIATMVDPGIYYVLPVLIAYTGGRMVYGVRGGVVGGFAVLGVIMATSSPLFLSHGQTGSPMFLGAMIMGPLTAEVMKRVDALWAGKIKPGFEMLVDNFSAGILGAIMAIAGMFVLAPPLLWVIDRLGEAVNWLVDHNVLPFTSVFIEPAKVLFLNNAVNHGVLTPLGIQQAQQSGKSVLFLLEANPAAGFGLLMAYTVFGKGMAKATAPGAAIIQFFGGIHEVYFPYVLMKPRLILAMIAGGMTQIFINVTFHSGLRAPAAPGSIFAVYAQTPPGSFLGVTLSVIGGFAVTFVIAGLLLRMDKGDYEGGDDLIAAMGVMTSMKGKESAATAAVIGAGTASPNGPIHSIVFACDAGMGSSAMGASVLRKKIQGAGYSDVTVVNKAISNLDDSFDLVVCHQDLAARAHERTPSAVQVSVDNFMASPKYDEIVALLGRTNGSDTGQGAATSEGKHAPPGAEPDGEILAADSIVLGGRATSRDDAIKEAGRLLVAAGAVDEGYLTAMHAREASVSTYMGNGLAIPHGTNEAKSLIHRTAMSFVRYDQPVDWNGKQARFVIGIAGAGDDHLALLARIAGIFTDEDLVGALERAENADQVRAVLDAVKV
jgi:PTS system mannitol-specific IIC component